MPGEADDLTVAAAKLPLTIERVDLVGDDLYAVCVEFADGQGGGFLIPGELVTAHNVRLSALATATVWVILGTGTRSRADAPDRVPADRAAGRGRAQPQAPLPA